MLIRWTETTEERPPIWSSFQQENQFLSFSKPPVTTHFYYQMEEIINTYTFFFPFSVMKLCEYLLLLSLNQDYTKNDSKKLVVKNFTLQVHWSDNLKSLLI